ncbi:MAG TPA: zinc ABC transporter substrate-binding protein, partial [Candidatus Acidoferrum sp.]|nr:zinc ABC transporter substrate-binding protein [Candidatus Acidoferrum sp.]
MSSAARHAMAVAIFALVVPLAGCTSVGSAASGGRPSVVATENFWGSIASQLGGDRVTVTSIIDNPNADPHDYEPTTDDARAMASANFVIENGVGYDPWAQRLIDANPVAGRDV